MFLVLDLFNDDNWLSDSKQPTSNSKRNGRTLTGKLQCIERRLQFVMLLPFQFPLSGISIHDFVYTNHMLKIE